MMLEPGRILLVDHSRGALIFQETILRRRDNAVMTALAGSDGLRQARDERPHLIIFGYDLFDMSAPEFCRLIREDFETRGTSLLLVGDREHQQQSELCLSAGCNDVIYRPFAKRELDAKVQKLTQIPVRRQLRTITRIEVSLENNGRFILGRSVNVSSNGMLLEVERVLPGEGDLRIHFYLPGDARPLRVDAHVLRAEFSGTMARYGVQFAGVSDEEKERIEQYVRRIRSRELL
jgi:response regulator RpfG family c-di-GMP phosphodiesterase